ncbi:MAG: hypothetical protein IJV25_04245 [Prevotella sp.]|nr:hypothetical protein [Prevotella sp.]MBQ9649613.1 hypothetical protein [Prevotella sp.]
MRKIIFVLMAAALLVVGLTACGGKKTTNAENNTEVESEESAVSDSAEVQDPYAYLVPDSSELFGMIPVHTFYAAWEKTENAKSYEEGKKVWERHWEMVNEDFKEVKGKVIPTEVAEGLAAKIVKPFTINVMSGGMIYNYSIAVELQAMAIIDVDPAVGKDSLKALGYDSDNNVVWSCGRFLNTGIMEKDYRVIAYLNIDGDVNAGLISKLTKIVVLKVGKEFSELDERVNSKKTSYSTDLSNMHRERKGQYTFDYGDK